MTTFLSGAPSGMTFLDLVKRLRQECGANGDGPSTTLSQTGESRRMVDWISDAWLEIQGLHDNWGFMREDFAFETVASTGDYSLTDIALNDHRYWHTDTLRAYSAAVGVADEQWLIEWDYAAFRNTYRFGVQTPGRPVVFAVKPNGDGLMFGAVPDGIYTIVGEYQRAPARMEADTDTPDIPEHLRMMIVHKAMEYFGLYEAAPEVAARGERQYRKLLTQLEREELPTVHLGSSLA